MMDRLVAEAFIDALEARRGIVAVVGAGGKKSTLHKLIEAHRAIGTKRIALTTTVRMAPPATSLQLLTIVSDANKMLPEVRSTRSSEAAALIAASSDASGRLSGVPSDLVQHIHTEGEFDVTLVKADGARMRLIKAPNDDEPLVPAGTKTILPIVSAKAFGKPISARIAHRPEKLLAVIDDVMGTKLQPHHVARLLSSDKGALQRAGQACVVPIINMVDKPELLDLARRAARTTLTATDRYERIVLASMLTALPLREIVGRP